MQNLRERVRAGTPVVGTFVKTASPQILEVLAHAGLDFVVLDAEHAPFGVEALSQSLAISGLAGLPALVRVPNHDAALISACMDMGAEGVLVPHVCSAGEVDAIADAVKFLRGKRGFSPSVRAGGYGTLPMSEFRVKSDERSQIWCQIEDADALDHLEQIAAHEAIDCLFIGPADLSLSLGLNGPSDPRLASTIAHIASVGSRYDRAVGLFVANEEGRAALTGLDITVVICGSDQSMLIETARRVSASFR